MKTPSLDRALHSNAPAVHCRFFRAEKGAAKVATRPKIRDCGHLDNITHTLTGLVVADIALQRAEWRTPRQADHFRGAVFAASALANNGPDLDFVYTGITGGKLGYLLHHR